MTAKGVNPNLLEKIAATAVLAALAVVQAAQAAVVQAAQAAVVQAAQAAVVQVTQAAVVQVEVAEVAVVAANNLKQKNIRDMYIQLLNLGLQKRC
jgi:hypothetical protein